MIHHSSKIVNVFVVVAMLFIFVAVCVVPLTPQSAAQKNITQPVYLLKAVDNGAFQQSLANFEQENYNLVKQYCSQYHLDYRLILAIIHQESRFDQDAVSERGAKGYMQIMPVTNAELNEQLELNAVDIPKENLQAGIYYFSRMMELFHEASPEDRISLALAAYNAGPARIYDAQDVAAYMSENPQKWTSIRHVLPLLSKRYYSLHERVWHFGKPKNGFFGSGRQTIVYVESVTKTYKQYRSSL